MKNKLIIYLNILVTLMICCNSNNNKMKQASPDGNGCHDNMIASLSQEDTCAFCPMLLYAIKSFINDYSDDIDRVVSIEINNDGNCCFVFLSTNMFYYTQQLYGYQIIDNKMVAYNYNIINDSLSYHHPISQLQLNDKKEFLSESDCSNNLINKSKLNTNYPMSFPNEYSDFATGWDYEPRGRKYIIHSPDSLELVFEGYY